MLTRHSPSAISAPTCGKPLVATPAHSASQKKISEETKATIVSARVTKSIMSKAAEAKKR